MLLGFGAIIMQILSVAVLGVLFFGPKKNAFLDFVDKHFLTLGFLVSGSAVFFSLFYSEVVKFPPCALCWWARVFMFPQAFLFGVALWFKDRAVAKYSMVLVLAGMLVSMYHNWKYYFTDSSGIPCDASGVSCYQQLVSEFGGYISIPMLSFTSLVALVALLAVAQVYNKRQ
jgi:disulfide bond formation protein DsbB